MHNYIFLDKTNEPTDKQIEDILSVTYQYWLEINQNIKSKYGSTISEWKFYSKKTGWTQRTLLNKRNLFFFMPFENYFTLNFVFGDKAVDKIQKSNVTKEIVIELLNAKKYAEGRGLLLEVRNEKILDDVYKLIEIKVNN